MYEQLCENTSLLKYIPTYKISQDHLETLFSCIRSHGGHNNNPTVQQFLSAYKKILLHTELRAAETVNCISLEHISIIHISARGVYVQSENIMNASCEMYRACNNIENSNWIEACDSSQIHNYVPNILQITEFSKRANDVFLICQKTEKALRFALRESGGTLLKPKFSEIYLTTMVFEEFMGSESILESLIQHAFEQDCLENHRIHLIRCIIQK